MFHHSEKTKIPANALPLRAASTVRSVSIDARVLLNMIQNEEISLHMDEGYVFGVMIDDVLEITNSISLPPERIQEFDSEQAREAAHQYFLTERNRYQQGCAESFRRLNLDSEVVGWYVTSFPEGACSKSTIETQFLSQSEMPNFVLISFDPFSSMSGSLHLRVLRLTPKYMQFHSSGDYTQTGVMISGLVAEEIYEEIPYTVHIPLLARVFLYETDFSLQDLPRDGNAVMMERDASAYIKRRLGDIAGQLDSLARDVAECTGKSMRRKSKESQEEARYNSLLTSRELPTALSNMADIGAQYTQGALLASMLNDTNRL